VFFVVVILLSKQRQKTFTCWAKIKEAKYGIKDVERTEVRQRLAI
jgi:hypothetical protein